MKAILIKRNSDALSASLCGDDGDTSLFIAETGADVSLFHNTGATDIVPGLKYADTPVFHRGWWFQLLPEAAGFRELEATKSFPDSIGEFISAAYAAGINPLPALRHSQPAIRWEWAPTSSLTSLIGEDWTVSGENLEQPTAFVGKEGDAVGVAMWDGSAWQHWGDQSMLPATK